MLIPWHGGDAGRGGGGRRTAAGGRPNGSGSAPPPVPAYLQPMKFISSGTMQTDEEVPSEQMRPGFRPAPIEASAAAMAASALNLEEGVDAADTGAECPLRLCMPCVCVVFAITFSGFPPLRRPLDISQHLPV